MSVCIEINIIMIWRIKIGILWVKTCEAPRISPLCDKKKVLMSRKKAKWSWIKSYCENKVLILPVHEIHIELWHLLKNIYITRKKLQCCNVAKKTVGPTFMLSASLVQFFWVFSLSGTGQRRHWHNCGSECSQLVCHPTKATPVISFKFVRDTGTWYTWHLKFKRNCKKISTCGRWHLETTYFSRSRTS